MTEYLRDLSGEYGAKRRKRLLQWFAENPEGMLAINRRGCCVLKYDPDIEKLLKQNKLKRVRQGITRTSKTTYLMFNENG